MRLSCCYMMCSAVQSEVGGIDCEIVSEIWQRTSSEDDTEGEDRCDFGHQVGGGDTWEGFQHMGVVGWLV